MNVDFDRMRAAGWSPIDAVAKAEAEGLSRLEAFKAIYAHWGPDAFGAADLERHGTDYPSRSARAAATVGLAVLVLQYPTCSADEFTRFEAVTGISRKVERLARAGRAEDALAFYDRLDPESLRLRPISETEARSIVHRERGRRSRLSSSLADSMVSFPWGWLFLPSDGYELGASGELPGGGDLRPIILDRFTGVPIEVVADEAPDVYVRRYETTGWPDADQ